MKYELEIKEEANQEIVTAYLYYEEKQEGLGERFLEHLKLYLDRVANYPEHYAVKRSPYREAFIKKFPYLIVYEFTGKKVVVYAVFNTWQDPIKKP